MDWMLRTAGVEQHILPLSSFLDGCAVEGVKQDAALNLIAHSPTYEYTGTDVLGGTACVRLCLEGISSFALVPLGPVVELLRRTTTTSVTLTSLAELLKNPAIDLLSSFAKAGISIWYGQMHPDTMMMLPPGILVFERSVAKSGCVYSLRCPIVMKFPLAPALAAWRFLMSEVGLQDKDRWCIQRLLKLAEDSPAQAADAVALPPVALEDAVPGPEPAAVGDGGPLWNRRIPRLGTRVCRPRARSGCRRIR